MLSIIDNNKEINSHEPAFEHILIAHGCHPRKNRIVNIFKNLRNFRHDRNYGRGISDIFYPAKGKYIMRIKGSKKKNNEMWDNQQYLMHDWQTN